MSTLLSKRGNDPTVLALTILRDKFGPFGDVTELMLKPGPSYGNDNKKGHDEDWIRNESPEPDYQYTFVSGWGDVREDSFVGLFPNFRRHTAEYLCFWAMNTHKAALQAMETDDIEATIKAVMRLGEAVRELEMMEVTGKASTRWKAEAKTPNTHKKKRRPQLLAMKNALMDENTKMKAAEAAFASLPRGDRPASPDALLKTWRRHRGEV